MLTTRNGCGEARLWLVGNQTQISPTTNSNDAILYAKARRENDMAPPKTTDTSHKLYSLGVLRHRAERLQSSDASANVQLLNPLSAALNGHPPTLRHRAVASLREFRSEQIESRMAVKWFVRAGVEAR